VYPTPLTAFLAPGGYTVPSAPNRPFGTRRVPVPGGYREGTLYPPPLTAFWGREGAVYPTPLTAFLAPGGYTVPYTPNCHFGTARVHCTLHP
jgi:hypothetical protein